MSTGSDVVGIGNAIVDVLSATDDDFLAQNGLVKGTMTLIDADQADAIYARLSSVVECSGGSAANTMAGLASLGSNGRYVGKVRDDALGRVFRDDIRASGVGFDTGPAIRGPGTGRCLVLVTPDGQRTMQTFLGASATLTQNDIDPEAVSAAKYTYLEGYLWDPPAAKQAFLHAAELAHEAGRKVALSLSDPFCVERHREEFRDLVAGHVDVLFGNEAEILALYESGSFEEAVRALKGQCELITVTRGAQGAVVLDRGGVVASVEAERVERVVDTTGAGDLYAAGFLHGLARGLDPATCARIGAIAAAEIISHFGARPEVSLSDRVERALE
jgi:sugar/nucleoside kinase (ribokinase family)